MNFELSWVCPSLISSGYPPLRFLEETILCTSTYHLCAQLCYFNGTSNSLIKFLTIDPSCPVFGSAGFSHGEWGSVVVCSIHFCLQWSVYFLPSSLCKFSRIYHCRNYHLPGVILQGSPILTSILQGLYTPPIWYSPHK